MTNAGSQYQLKFSASWDTLPADLNSKVSLACCHVDDRYYEDGLGIGDGYHATMSAAGLLELYRHRPSAPDELLGQAQTPPLAAGQ